MPLNTDSVKLVIGETYVNEVVRDFARAQGLESRIQHHGGDLWCVESWADKDTIRQVQVAAFDGHQGPGLYFIPQASRFVNGEWESVRPETCAAGIRTIPLTEFYKAVMEGRKGDLAHDLKQTLKDAWTTAQAFSLSDLVKTSFDNKPSTPHPA